MKTFTTIAILAAFAQTALAQTTALFINTPASLVECQPALLNFGGGAGQPYFISALPAGQVSATPLLNLPTQTTTSYSWTVNLPAGTNISLSVRDSAGSVQYSSPVAIQAGTSSACLDAAGASSASAVGAIVPTSAVASSASASPAVTVPASSAVSGTLVSSAASATVTAAAGVPSSVPSTNGTETAGNGTSYNFTCAPGQDLTYGITTAVLQGVTLEQAVGYFNNWTADAPGPLLNSSGTGVGAQRAYTLNGNLTIAETLITNQTNATTGSLHQQWNLTQRAAIPVTGNLTLYNSFDDLTVYTNTTSNTTNLQYFILACFNDQAQGVTALAATIQSVITYYSGQLNGTNATTAGASTTAMAAATTAARRMVKLF